MSENTTTSDKQFTFLDENRQQVIFTPKKYAPKSGQLIGVTPASRPAHRPGNPANLYVGSPGICGSSPCSGWTLFP